MNNTELTPEEIERLAKIKAENDKIKSVLKSAAYVLISAFTARKAFLSAIREIPETDEPLVDVFARGEKEVKAEGLKKLAEQSKMYND